MIVLLLSFSQVRALQVGSFNTANELLVLCEAWIYKTDLSKANKCFGYITGVSDVHAAFVSWEAMEQRWCLPEDIKSSQLVRVVTKELQENPQDLHMDGGSAVANALLSAFPCE